MLDNSLYGLSQAEYLQLEDDLQQLSGAGGGIYSVLPQDQHLLIGGATGAGKSVLINGFLADLLTKTPYEEWLILIDPKMVELQHLRPAPHTAVYASDDTAIVKALQFAVRVLTARLHQMSKQGVSLYQGGRIHIVIDELASIMANKSLRKQVEPLLSQLLLLGRAAKVYVVAATQRATAAVITGIVKSNIVHRVALRTATRQESRNILEINGAETLPRYGECIYFDGIDYRNLCVPYRDKADIIKLVDEWTDWRRCGRMKLRRRGK